MNIKEAIAHCEMLLNYGILSSEDEEPMKVVLAELEKKDNEIERYKMMLAETHANFLNSDLRTKRKNDEDLLMLNEGWKMELKKKEKIIKNMAKTINEAYFGSGDFEEWFENKICKVQKYEDYTYVEKDIKEYFERKAGK